MPATYIWPCFHIRHGMKKNPAKKRKKVRYRTVNIKLTDKQHQLLKRHSRVLGISSNKTIRLALREFMERNADKLPPPSQKVGRNQLNLFEQPPAKLVQLSILDAIRDQQVAEE